MYKTGVGVHNVDIHSKPT